MADVFISYKSDRRAAVEHLTRILELNGYSVWFDYGLLSGQNFARQIEREIRAAKVVLVLWCQLSVDSEWVNGEARLATRLGKMIPAWIQDVDLPLEFNGADTINLEHWDGSPRSHVLDRLFEQIGARVGREQVPQIAGLKDFDSLWRRYGAPNLLSFPLEKVIPEFEKNDGSPSEARHVTSRPSVTPSDEPVDKSGQDNRSDGHSAAAREKKTGSSSAFLMFTAGLLLAALLGGGGYATWHYLRPAAQPPIIVPPPVEAQTAIIAPRPVETQTPIVTPPQVIAPPPIETQTAVIAPLTLPSPSRERTPGRSENQFRDCEACPLMVMIPEGKFLIGSPDAESGHKANEAPRREISIKRKFAIARLEVSFAEWDACVADSGCRSYRPNDYGMGRGNSPVIFVSFFDAIAYAAWMSTKTGATYRLPSEAEWEFAARGCIAAGCANDPFGFGGDIGPDLANYNWNTAYNGSLRRQPRRQTMAVEEGSKANGFGLLHVHGNVAEWVQDCVNGSYDRLPENGAPATSGDCRSRVVRGGNWNDNPRELRSSARAFEEATTRSHLIGFRLARDLTK
ncbi:SUMF1/EgtB/PvdO family nonheme iron enzyme [Candidatus Raskinella chloraquaticus]|jgi:formylglycine-generating enzyme required for sulfatase activity|uniref:TIR domain-containing protein n=1 Tax=Candidatus Raskinella chloraquaticus TaxID=1951219 RepID=A0A1W9HQ78_9HYPH|nr:MAG: hypothetical protein A4S15_02280 [Proteobacteria bacterium SG_bin8]